MFTYLHLKDDNEYTCGIWSLVMERRGGVGCHCMVATHPCLAVCTSLLGCRNKLHQLGGLHQQKLILSKF